VSAVVEGQAEQISLLERAKNFLLHRSRAYRLVFHDSNPYTDEVLRDLAKFCRADRSTFHSDARAHAVMEGRREVWLRIQHHLHLTPDELTKLYARKDIQE
jgi:ribosomal protein S24E